MKLSKCKVRVSKMAQKTDFLSLSDFPWGNVRFSSYFWLFWAVLMRCGDEYGCWGIKLIPRNTLSTSTSTSEALHCRYDDISSINVTSKSTKMCNKLCLQLLQYILYCMWLNRSFGRFSAHIHSKNVTVATIYSLLGCLEMLKSISWD